MPNARSGRSTKVDRSPRPRAARRRDGDVTAAAIKVFFARGYEAATVQDVADELGILKGSLYHYIRTKEDLLFRLFERVHEDVRAILVEVDALTDISPLERLRVYVQRQVEYNLEHLPSVAIYYHDMESLTGDRLEYVIKSRREHDQFVTRLIKEAQATGEAASDLDPRVMSPCIFASVIWTYRWYQPEGRLGRAKIAEQIAKFATRGVAGSGPAPRALAS
jgi:AcrR family transcriptional regulator